MNELPVLIVAPHVMFPERNGAEITIERVARFLTNDYPHVDLVACNTVRRYRNGVIESERLFVNRLRGKRCAGIRTIVLRSHYLVERFNTDAYRKELERVAKGQKYGLLFISYINSIPLVEKLGIKGRRFVWTHNDDYKWFGDLTTTGGVWSRMAARLTVKWLEREVPSLTTGSVMVHVTEKDRQGYEEHVPGHSYIVANIGTDIDEVPAWPLRSSQVIITFCGGLSMQMALDALDYFAERFYPKLKLAFGEQLRIRVVGSRPSAGVLALCETMGWELHRDVADQELSRLLRESSMTMLPFPYATGVKLKLLRSLGSGVPFLSTRVCAMSSFPTPPACLFSDEPDEWVLALQSWNAESNQTSVRKQLLAVAEQFSWRAVVHQLASRMDELC